MLFANTSLRTKFLIIPAIAAVLLIIASSIYIIGERKENTLQENINDHDVPNMRELSRLFSEFSTNHAQFTSLLASSLRGEKDEEQFYTSGRKYILAINRTLAELRNLEDKLTTEGKHEEITQRLQQLLIAYRSQMGEIVTISAVDLNLIAKFMLRVNEAYDKTNSEFLTLIDAVQADINLANRNIQTDRYNEQLRFLIILGFIIAFILISSILLYRSFAFDLTSLTTTLKRLSEGDTNIAQPVVERHDEFGAVNKVIDAFKQALQSRDLAEAELRRNQTMMARTEHVARVGSWEWDVASDKVSWSDELYRIFQRDPADGVPNYEGQLALYTPEDAKKLSAAVEAAVTNGTPYAIELCAIRKDGTKRMCLAIGNPEMDQNGKVIRLAGSLQDITERTQQEARIKQSEARLRSLFDLSPIGIALNDYETGSFLEVNDALLKPTGYTQEEFIALSYWDITPREYEAQEAQQIKNLEKMGSYGPYEKEYINKNGNRYPVLLNGMVVHDLDGRKLIWSIVEDLTERKQAEQALHDLNQALEHRAHYDLLTSLPNRALLADRLEQGMAQSQRRGKVLAVAYLDLDGFKEVNDAHGHDFGDDLLVYIAQQLNSALRDGDTLARIGGDEFVAILVDLDAPQDCEPVLARLLYVASDAISVRDKVLNISTSIGVTFYPNDSADADQLIRHADQAMYEAKQSGKNRYQLFDVAQDSRIKSFNENITQIEHAINNDEFVLHYQPKVNMQTGELVGAEALIRWQHPERGLLQPGSFLPIVENHELSIALDEWVIQKALAQLDEWHIAGLKISVSVNVGPLNLQRRDFVSRLRQSLSAHPTVLPKYLELEILESSALNDITSVTGILDQCHEMGVLFSLDDFGTGYSTLTYLRALPADTLKIDQSFVRDMADDPNDLAIVQGVLGLAKAFNRSVIAEGVETIDQGELLLKLGCHYAQGYGIARPMPPEELPVWVESWRPDPRWLN